MVAGASWPFIVSVLAPILREELGFSAGGLGVAYAAYYLVASGSSRPAGRFVDRHPVRRSGWVLGGFGIAQLLVFATATSWAQLVASGLIAGVCLGLSNPVTNAAIAASLNGPQSRWVVGVKQAGVPIAGALAGAAVPALAALFGWRGAVLASLALPVAALATAWLLRGGPSRPSSPDAAEPTPRLGLEVYAFLLGIVAAALNGYLALYVVDALDGSVQRAGAVMAAFAAAGASGRALWPAVAGGPRTVPLLRVLGVAGSVALLGLALPGREWLVWAAVVFCGLTVMAWQGLGMLAVLQRGSVSVGEASGRVLRMFYGGFVIGSPLVGASIDHFGFAPTWGALVLVGLAAALSVRAPAPVPQR